MMINMNNFYSRPAWIEVDLNKFRNNIVSIKNRLTPGTEIMSVVKADGYKHGAIPLVREAVDLGISYFAVATFSEALILKKEFSNIHILKLGYTPDYLIEESIKEDIASTIYTVEQAEKFDKIAKSLNKKAIVHISIDTGMSRIGFIPNEDSLNKILQIFELENLEIEGIFSHFAAADSDKNFTKEQFVKFKKFTDTLIFNGCHFKFKHIANSAAILYTREYDLDMARPGVIQYGYTDTKECAQIYGLEPILSVKAEISNVKYVENGQSVGYSRKYYTSKKTKVVTLPIGYADGFPRILSDRINVLINGIKCPQIGYICMDQLMVDATGVNCEIGDEAVIIGKQDREEISVRDICNLSGDCETSFITHFDKRLPRLYYKDNKVIEVI
ncbi:alanine racemase [Peptoniphilus olsenii]|uniref:Alanine racemase n=1 Tax=Peptoniphilus olsenii TaxID=411570 RepID=A0ABV2J725_9FIRM